MSESAPARGLRERRRRETTALIHQAAVDCVERDGLEATTVARIAETAGVSARTFFRYFPSKEAAILPGQGELRVALLALAANHPPDADAALTPRHAVGRLMGRLGELIRDDPIDHHEHRRIGALLDAEPELRAHLSSEDGELTRVAVTVLRALAPSFDAGEARLHAELAFSAWRVALWTWDTMGSTPEHPTPYSRWLWALDRMAPAVAAMTSSAADG
ncbi:TetR/AcrR family transcriptional regulator [Rhodococcus sp. HNM0563]|uniref:TetR/AcrR family transcriptional regulator n=1 Tax=unclassified Rhodococcus (in: high G+C Gram-positive bacteria) TaxID=192944 RepID=UPI00146E492A|nr:MULTISPECIES: TetR/AcrR family transcriptional regulator [unclassified Rhodococcus (in: high G+C Gram-positive bacteria)]MCK0091692.1 TetR/AcrR family transcriptional regulator [Rhodococcus sp. F64268]NLU64032.1 TetR/AcrR family transcriptional regulator [Rhodococcus sp. HNM0563]